MKDERIEDLKQTAKVWKETADRAIANSSQVSMSEVGRVAKAERPWPKLLSPTF